MQEPTLVIMAAGMGSRFGGLKQVTPVDEAGHPIIDFSLYDAWRAGFRRVVFIIKPFIGMSAQRRKELIAGCLTSGGLLAALRPGGLAEIKRRQALGDDIFIVTSTIDCLIEPIAAHLGVKYVAAAPLEYDAEGKVTGRIAGLVPYQGQKVTRIQEILTREGISNADSAAFGDSVNDFEMLCFAAHGKAVHPSPLLLDKAKAQGRSFEILNWDQA